MFSRKFWDDIGYYIIVENVELGLVEEKICSYCPNKYQPIMCNLETIAGHLGYYVQNDICRKNFEYNPDGFKTY